MLLERRGAELQAIARPALVEDQNRLFPLVPAGDLVVNELMADNRTTLADGAGEYDDWLELVNRGSADVGLAGWFLGPSAGSPWRYALPDVVLAPGERYLVWCRPRRGPGT